MAISSSSLVTRDVSILPPCIQAPALQILSQVGCADGDLNCACHNRKFLAGLQVSIYQSCPPSDIASAFSSARKYCTTVNPGLTANRNAELVIPIVIFMVLAIFSVMLRFYARRISKAHLGKDDWLAALSLVFGIATDILNLYGLRNGEGHHQFMVDLNQLETSQKSLLATVWTLTAAVLLLKLAVLALYWRLFATLTAYRYALIVSVVIVTVLELATALIYTLSCHPFEYFWNKTIPGGSCLNSLYVNTAWCAADLATGLWVLILPIPVLKHLHASSRKKIAVAALFIVGGFVCVAAAIRIPFILLLDGNDATWSAVPYTIWTNLEVNVGIVSVCLPTLRPLHHINKFLSSRSKSRSKPHSRSYETGNKIYSGNSKTKATNGVCAAPATPGAADQQRILGKEDEENWPMSSIGVTKEVNVSSDRSFT